MWTRNLTPKCSNTKILWKSNIISERDVDVDLESYLKPDLKKACGIENYSFCKMEIKSRMEPKTDVLKTYFLITTIPKPWDVIELDNGNNSEFEDSKSLLELLEEETEYSKLNITTSGSATNDSGGIFCDSFHDRKVLVWFATVIGGISVIAAGA